jgi:two-component system, sensor histidine kinase and response regulator
MFAAINTEGRSMIDFSLKNARIIVVDDEAANIDVLEGLLEFQGFENVKTTTDPTIVNGLCEEFNPDLILLDLMMSPISGFDVMEQLRTYRKQDTYLPVLVLTADISAETRQRALSVGANDFLTKPFDLIEVGLRIKNLLETRLLYKQAENQNVILETKVKERTSELEKSNAELIIARNKAEAGDRLKTEFIRNISHEIRTPMNGIIGICTLLADKDLTASEKLEFLPLLRTSVNRMINTFTDYLDISMIVSDNLVTVIKPFDVNKELIEIEDKFSPACESKNLIFNLNLPHEEDAFVINSDRELFRKIISHLVDNAVKFTNEGSVSLGYSVNGNSVVFYVKDTGIGISKEAGQSVFESFIQENTNISRIYEGSGLGLSIVKGFLIKLGGEISLESDKDKGSVFFVKLPL